MRCIICSLVLVCAAVCKSEHNHFRRDDQENLRNEFRPGPSAMVPNKEIYKRVINHLAANPYNIHPIYKNPQAGHLHFNEPNMPLLSSLEYKREITKRSTHDDDSTYKSFADRSELLANIENIFGPESQHATADDLEEKHDGINEQHTVEQNTKKFKLQSRILQFVQPESETDILKNRYIRATNEYAGDILANNPELQANIESIFGSYENSNEPYSKKNDNQAIVSSLQYDPELKAIIEKTLGATHTKLKHTKAQNYELSTDRSDMEDPSLTKHKRGNDENTANTSEPPKLNPMILKLFGPEVLTPMDNTNDQEITDQHSENNNGDGNSLSGTSPDSVQLQNETNTGDEDNGSQASKTSVLVCVIMCVLLLFNM